MSDPVIRVESLSKRYQIGLRAKRLNSFREAIMQTAAGPFRRLKRLSGVSQENETFWALKDVSFEVRPGEVVGIIGRNGAGKSTLLKILSRITEPTEGQAIIRGRVGSLLEVGTGFHSELTGRENIYLNGSILGMTRGEIERKFDEIVEFSGIEKFIDTPVKRYSSGMTLRLGFAVAAHLEPEILVVDEVLAVGDFEFQKKCLRKMNEVAAGGRTILFVSHNMTAVQRLCTRGLLLSGGMVEYEGTASSTIARYLESGDGCLDSTWSNPDLNREHALQIRTATASLEGKQPHCTLVVRTELKSEAHHRAALIAFDIADSSGDVVMQALPSPHPFIDCSNCNHVVETQITLPPLIPGRYSISIWVGTHNTQSLDAAPSCLAFEITDSPTPERIFPHTPDHGHIVPFSRYEYSTY